jgi:threonine/homoserine/homoserine lactone efflux protein
MVRSMELELPLALRGLVLGLTIAAAVGPITLLVIRRTIDHGGVYGFGSGLGVAAADGTYAAIAAFGLTAITSLLLSAHTLLGVLGGAVIAIVGARTILSRPAEAAPDLARPGLVGAALSMFGLTMTNPLTIILYASVFAGIGLAASASFVDAAVLTLAVLAGSTLWWAILCSVVAWVRERVSTTALLWVNRISGAALVLFGVTAIVSAFAGSA